MPIYPLARLRLRWLLAPFIISLVVAPLAYAQQPVVRAVLFFSPTCSHCQKVMYDVLPPLQQKYGDSLVIFTVDVTQPEGADLYQAMVDRYQVTEERFGVPALAADNILIVGSKEIPERFPGIIADGLARGGIDWSDIPGLEQALPAELGGLQVNGEASGSMLQKFMQDPLANSLAVILLAGMLISIIWISSLFLSSSLTAMKTTPEWVIPLLSLFGILVAGYLSYIEVTRTDAFCGPIGDCNSVQQSPYATLFGVLPVGVLGIAGYIAIAAAWLIKRYGPQNWRDTMNKAIWGMALFGVLFMSYLTFLEPFVIGATCSWCLTSAMIITLILWASTPAVINPMRAAERAAEQTGADSKA